MAAVRLSHTGLEDSPLHRLLHHARHRDGGGLEHRIPSRASGSAGGIPIVRPTPGLLTGGLAPYNADAHLSERGAKHRRPASGSMGQAEPVWRQT